MIYQNLTRLTVLLCESWLGIYSFMKVNCGGTGGYMEAEPIQIGHHGPHNMPVPQVLMKLATARNLYP